MDGSTHGCYTTFDSGTHTGITGRLHDFKGDRGVAYDPSKTAWCCDEDGGERGAYGTSAFLYCDESGLTKGGAVEVCM
jgi:hypothetical protein